MRRREFLALAASSAAAASPDAFVRVSLRDPRYLELSDGRPYIPIGLNMIRPEDAWIEALARNGGNYLRVWLSNPYFDVEHARSGEFDDVKAERIDRMLDTCRSRGIRVKMTIEHFRSIGEPPVRQAWADKPIHLAPNGGLATGIADFFDGEASRRQFKRKLKWYRDRYGDNPTIYGWELWNEINAVRGGNYMAWTEEMLPELHRLFPKNLAMQSLGSFDTDRVRDIYRRHSLLESNDVAQVHRYHDLGASLEVCKGPVDVLAADAVRELLSYKPKKPVLLAESGAVEPRHTGPSKLYKDDKDGTILHDVLFAPFFAGAAGPGQIWHWDSYVAEHDLWWHFGRFAEVVKGIDPASESFEPAYADMGSARVYTLRGRRTSLVWVRASEESATGVTIDVPAHNSKLYDPWTGRWSNATGRKLVHLPPFRRSIAVVAPR